MFSPFFHISCCPYPFLHSYYPSIFLVFLALIISFLFVSSNLHAPLLPPPTSPPALISSLKLDKEQRGHWSLLATLNELNTHTRTHIENTHTQETQQYVSAHPCTHKYSICPLLALVTCSGEWIAIASALLVRERKCVCTYVCVCVCVFVCVSSYKLTVIRMTDRASRAWRTLLMLARLPEQSVCGTNLMLHWSSACLPGTVCVCVWMCVCVCVCVSVWFVCTFINCLTQTDWLLTLPFSPSFEFPPILFVLLLCLFSSFLTPVHFRSVEPVLKSGLDAAKSVFSYLIHLVFKDVIYIIMQHFLL